jgi:hypothetical protein
MVHEIPASARARCAAGNRSEHERGVVLIWATASVMLIAGVIFAAADRLAGVDKMTTAEFSTRGQAQAIARAGITDAIAWLRRSSTQPVAHFEPGRDPRLPPPAASDTPEKQALTAAALAEDPVADGERLVNETEDPDIGIVRSFEISPGLWGRYSVIRGTQAESFVDTNLNGIYDPDEDFSDANGDGHWTPGRWTRDITTDRGLAGSGAVWFLAARGEVYKRPDTSLPLGEGPNKRIAEAIVASEVRRLTIAPPAAAALLVSRGDNVSVGLRARIRGDTAIAYGANTGVPSLGYGEVLGNSTSVPSMSLALEDVFGVSWAELRSMADISTSDPVGGLPSVLPDYSLTVVAGDLVFDKTRPLRGNGVLVVKGDVTIESGSNSFFRGVLYVDGNLRARAPAYLRGTFMVTGDADLRGTGGDFCELEHDATMVSLLLSNMGQYRFSKAPFAPQPKLLDGRASSSGISRRRFGDPSD